MRRHLSFASLTVSALAILVVGLPNVAHAVPITTLFGTGLDAFGLPLPGAAIDLDYLVVETGTAAIVRTQLPGTYFPNDANSQWIWETAGGAPTNTIRTFRTTFDLTGLDPTTAVINGAWGTDNIGIDILINGTSTGIMLPGVTVENFNQLHPFIISSGFVQGINTLDFIVQDAGVVSAFRAQLSGSAQPTGTPIPEPGTLALAAALGALFLAGRAQRRLPSRRG